MVIGRQAASPRVLAACRGVSELSRGCRSSTRLGNLVSLPVGGGCGFFVHLGRLGPWWPLFARYPEPRGFERQWAWSGSLTSRRQRAACFEPRTRGGGEAGPGPWGRLAARSWVFPRGSLPSSPRGGDSLLARLCCRLAGGTQGSKARPDWALPGTDARSVY